MGRWDIPKIGYRPSITSVAGESLDTGDGATTTFSGTLNNPHVVPSTLSITDGTQTVTDDGSGNLTGDGSGTIDYSTGDWSVTFDAAPADGASITADYDYYADVIEIGYPLDNARSWTEPMESSEQVVAPSGVRDAWVTRQEPRLQGDWRWIPTTDETATTGAPITGWDGSRGVRWFIEKARAMNKFDFYPDRTAGKYITCYLVEPMSGMPDLEEDETRNFTLVIAAESASDKFTGY